MSSFAQTLGINIDFYRVGICWALIFARIFVMFMMIPFLGGRAVPARVRTAAVMALTTFVYPFLVSADLVLPENKGLLVGLFLKEIFFGFSVGLVTVMIFHALESAGSVMDMQRGGGNAQLVLPQLGQVSIFGLWNYWMAIAFFLSTGGHRKFLEAFFMSYKTVPLLEFPPLAPGFSPFLEFVVRLSGDVLVIAVQLSAPIIIAILLVDIVLGIANKMAPQINVFELGFAVKGYIAPVMLYVSFLIIVSQIDVILKGMNQSVYNLAQIFAR